MVGFRAGEEKSPAPPGSVVRLTADATLTRDTAGAGPVLLVSTTPSIAAGVPEGGGGGGAAVAFLGRAPARCRGPVRRGDRLVPSGLGDGVCVAFTGGCAPRAVVGVAMHESPGDGERAVVAFRLRRTRERGDKGARAVRL